MWIEARGELLVNLDRLKLMRVRDNCLVAYSDDFTKNILIAEYSSSEICRKVLRKIKFAIKEGKSVFDVPTEDELNKNTEKEIINKKQPCMSMEEAINLWNTLADRGFKQVSRRGENTKSGKMLKARLLEYTKEQWEQAIANIRKSDILQKNQQKWFDFDWFVCPSNFVKVLDGKYNDSATDHMKKTEKEWWEE